ncbi:hypothetical protein PY093_20110 [Cytobacillus sp. S13-E01]|uniref:hypothetical protein n=1 Tax=Cytobacillus sp. S13-E01 TaxID=3031326 RepID=UPI0023D8A820|nr:hypothetical protein [Cytobacillus sp. S13-E01]MDF0728920.1 hypothetical protein [Cytobacillus sp. S13-E01]
MGRLIFGEREYTVTNEEDKVVFKDISSKGVRVDFSFSKDKVRNKLAMDGLKQFWTEVYR